MKIIKHGGAGRSPATKRLRANYSHEALFVGVPRLTLSSALI
jgi:hypothetical protein